MPNDLLVRNQTIETIARAAGASASHRLTGRELAGILQGLQIVSFAGVNYAQACLLAI